jgi:Cu(I)/Ag(I) efflux system periplasmic protein CusF
MKRIVFLSLIGCLLALPGYADEKHPQPTADAAKAETAMSEGEVRRVDKGAKKITIKHGTLENLDMPPMTMVFHVKDPSMLNRVKPGDKVRFRAELEKGVVTVVRIEPQG